MNEDKREMNEEGKNSKKHEDRRNKGGKRGKKEKGRRNEDRNKRST